MAPEEIALYKLTDGSAAFWIIIKILSNFSNTSYSVLRMNCLLQEQVLPRHVHSKEPTTSTTTTTAEAHVATRCPTQNRAPGVRGSAYTSIAARMLPTATLEASKTLLCPVP